MDSVSYSIRPGCGHLSKTGRASQHGSLNGCIEVLANPLDDAMKGFFEEVLGYPDVPSRWRVLDVDGGSPPFLTIKYR
jgi:hypothetical protein